jgi:hypothetical protein
MSVFATRLSQLDSKPLVRSFMILTLLGVAFLMGRAVATAGAGLDFRAALVGAIAFVIVVALIVGRRAWGVIFYLWIFTFALGYRTFHITSNLSIHPAELIIWFLFFGVAALNLIQHRWVSPPLPFVAWGFAAFWVIGVGRALQRDIAPDVIAAELLPVLEVVPVFLIVQVLVTSKNSFRSIGACLTAVCFYISLLGNLEFFFPSVVAPFRGFFAESVTGLTDEGFLRASFSFWGSAVVVQLLVLFLPLLFVQWFWWRRFEQRLFLLVTLFLTLVAIYIAGYRSVWLLVIFEIAFYALMRFSILGGMVTLAGGIGTSLVLPGEAVTRLSNLLQFGALSDSSAFNRALRIEDAQKLFFSEPLLGNGWGSSGWVHSDWLQIAANLGGIALLLVLLWYGSVTLRLWRAYRTAAEPWVREVSISLLTFMVGFAVILATQAVIVLPQLIIPMWLLFALSDRLPRLLRDGRSLGVAA